MIDYWMSFWKLCLIGVITAFGLLAVITTFGGAADLRRMFQKLNEDGPKE